MADISIRNLSRTYSGQKAPATDDVSLDVADGEFMVFLGPSGCGKTTLLRMIAGLELPDAGSVAIGGKDVTYLAPRNRNLSMVFQSYAVFPHRRVRANIGFGLKMRGVAADEIARRVDRAADLLQLTDYLDRYPAQLSGGQRQRVAVARAIVVDADVLLMDEPLSNLDALLRLSFRAELKKIVAELGTTTVYVTHDQAEALSLGDRVAVMRSGRIVQQGGPIDVYDSPADTFVGGFLGSPPMNFLDGEVADGPKLRVGEQSLAVPSALASFAGQPVKLGVRAENITVSQSRDESAVPATVDVVEPVGASVLLTVTVDGQELKVQAPPTFRIDPGATAWLTFPADRLRFYDPESAMALETDR
ncbi:ABC transporter ATP-binding protein [Stackebrandtia nassauensis]|uniref:ABC transporter related protein n=1 Tax=Stackebrandtia nassauensis (strain DSM 44728 / CIP 108903 / NRRL B-16338 / NBRC 102104 / LLR-40K-21) TaxID=446470 RepID=D3Q1P2_STANL|nr:ABC transporter ATP-binding protein [Stackebrandtia nassauensis]ADD39890.1 ABC transporter related protein [Stackebrandtia nassauensis DSM 44728]